MCHCKHPSGALLGLFQYHVQLLLTTYKIVPIVCIAWYLSDFDVPEPCVETIRISARLIGESKSKRSEVGRATTDVKIHYEKKY